MQLEVSKNILLKALSHGQSVVEKRTTIPVLSHVLLEALENKLTISATNLDMALIETVEASVTEQGSICVSAHLLHDIVRKLRDSMPIQMFLDKKTLHLKIQSGRSQFLLPGIEAMDFPKLTQTPLTHHFTIETQSFSYLLDHSQFAICLEETHYSMNGIYLHAEDKMLRAVATDGHRLACIGMLTSEAALAIPGVIVGKRTVQEIRRLLEESKENVEIGLSKNRIEMVVKTSNSEAIFSSRLIDAQYPDYREVLVDHGGQKLVASTKELTESIDRIATVLTDQEQALQFKVQDGALYLSAVNNAVGTAEEVLDVDYSGSEVFTICLNARYILEALREVKSPEVSLTLSTPDLPVLMELSPASENSEEYYVLMPLLD